MIPFTIAVHKTDPAAGLPLDALIFTPRDIQSLEYVASVSLDGDAVQADEFAAVLRSDNPGFLADWQGVTQSSTVILDGGGRTEKYYFKELRRVGKDAYQLAAQSPIARLSADFPGDVYTAKPLPEVLAAVVGGVVPYACNPLLGSVRVNGWAPYQSRRETLHALALAYGFLIRRDAAQNLYFTVPDTDADGYQIPDNNIFTGGSVSYSMGSTYRQAQITANDYRPDPDAAPQTLFDNTGTAPAQSLLVKFDAPMSDVAAEGLTIEAGGVNYAVVSGVGVLTGKPYAKYSSVVVVDGDPDADPAHILSVTDAPLITSLNAASVGERLLSYHNAEATVSADIIRTAQSPGDLVSFTDPFGDPRAGYIAALSGSITTIDRANASIVCGYSPTWGAAYDAVEILTGGSSWTVPAYLDGKTVRVVLIGGGQGGASGQHGSGFVAADGVQFAVAGSGRGLPGKGGRVWETKIEVSAGQEIPFSIGAGGAGGAVTDETAQDVQPSAKAYESGGLYHLRPHGSGTFLPSTVAAAVKKGLKPCQTCLASVTRYYVSNPGQDGTPTTFGEFSSDDGAPATAGFYDAIENIIYAAPGADNGVDGGQSTAAKENGNRDAPAYTDVQRFAVALPWDAGQTWQSGNPGECFRGRTPAGETLVEWSYGGMGGGAAVGADGGDGQRSSDGYPMWGGTGGKGADASAIFPPDSRAYGCGGSGGHGGGEGGMGGSGNSSDPSQSAVPVRDGAQGAGGAGSDGQDGKNGCILIYFKKPNDFYQFKFRVEPGTGEVILEYYTEEPPPFYADENNNLHYEYPDGETPPNFVRRGKNLYLQTD